MAWLISAASSAVTGHVSGRSGSWWTGSNSLWGRLTGGGSERADSYDVTVETAREGSGMNPLVLVAIAYFVFK